MAFQKLQQAQDAYDRLKPMHENGTLPEIKWVEVETGLSQAKSATAIAKKGLDDTKLYAVTAGVIGKKSIQEGENVFPNITVFELFDISKVHVKIPVPEDEISSFKKGDQATITVGAISKTINGIVREIGGLYFTLHLGRLLRRRHHMFEGNRVIQAELHITGSHGHQCHKALFKRPFGIFAGNHGKIGAPTGLRQLIEKGFVKILAKTQPGEINAFSVIDTGFLGNHRGVDFTNIGKGIGQHQDPIEFARLIRFLGQVIGRANPCI